MEQKMDEINSVVFPRRLSGYSWALFNYIREDPAALTRRVDEWIASKHGVCHIHLVEKQLQHEVDGSLDLQSIKVYYSMLPQ